MKAVIITRKHPYLNFGQTVTIFCKNKKYTALADGDTELTKLEKHEFWPFDKMYDHEELNEALENAK